MGRSVLITGGGGMIGQEIARQHIEHGDSVYIYDKRLNPYNDYSNMIGIDLGEYRIQELFEHYKFDIISHQASLVSVGDSMINPEKYFLHNVQFTAELLQAILDTNSFPSKLLLASSMGTYGEGSLYCERCEKIFYYKNQRHNVEITCPVCDSTRIHPVACKEEASQFPQSFYGLTKLAQEEMFRIFAQTYNVPTIALRYFSVYSDTANPTNPFVNMGAILINKFINATSDSIELYEDGNQGRDLVHVYDVARANLIATEYEDRDNFFSVFNVGCGEMQYLKDIATLVKKELNATQEVTYNNKVRRGDLKWGFPDISSI
jgi:dTDP-L-rhamnose 4-epimerase